MDIFDRPATVDLDVVSNLGPFRTLPGVWEGEHGLDVSMYAGGPVETPFRERLTFDPIGPVVNGPQVLYGLRYATVACRLADGREFHEEVGYWLWDPATGQAMRCFMVPRGVTVLAGAFVDPDAARFTLEAEAGAQTFGILSNPFLDRAFKTVHYQVTVDLEPGGGGFSYSSDTVLRMHGVDEPFHHTDRNKLRLHSR